MKHMCTRICQLQLQQPCSLMHKTLNPELKLIILLEICDNHFLLSFVIMDAVTYCGGMHLTALIRGYSCCVGQDEWLLV